MREFMKLVAVVSVAVSPSLFADEPDPQAVFEQRLMPIFKSEDPSSCVQCHLSSVDLRDYILPSSRETFLSLRDQGLIDTEQPRESKILHLIEMGDSDPDSLARRIHAKTRMMEYEAFASWIEACCQDSELRDATAAKGTSQVGPSVSDEVIRHARKDRVLDSFVRNIWSQRMRCFPCHTPSELDKNNPMHVKPIERYEEFVRQYGARMNVFRETPQETMRSLIASSRKHTGDRLPLINVREPLQSLLLLKPMAKLPALDENGVRANPSARIPVSHMGGIKLHKDDHSYKAFAAWLQDYASSVSGVYESDDALPEDNWFPTEHVIRFKELPATWPALSTAQVVVHRWDPERKAWSAEPAAFTQSIVTPRKMINGVLFALAGPEDRNRLNPTGETLQPGKVQLRVYLDRDEAIAESPAVLLNDREPDATAMIDAAFGKGFKNADMVEGAQLSIRGD